MKVLWLSESGHVGKVPRNWPNMRTEYAWQHASGGHHENIMNVHNIDEQFDIGIVILPKREDIIKHLSDYQLLEKMRSVCKKVG